MRNRNLVNLKMKINEVVGCIPWRISSRRTHTTILYACAKLDIATCKLDVGTCVVIVASTSVFLAYYIVFRTYAIAIIATDAYSVASIHGP